MDRLNTLEKYSPEVKKEVTFDVFCESQGKTQDHNEDAYFLNTKNLSFGIFDGMGGESNGSESSNLCRDLIQQELYLLSKDISLNESEKKLTGISKKIIRTFSENTKKYNLGGSTGTFGVVHTNKEGKQTLVGNSLGDSRAYLFRPSNIKEPLLRLTSDDNIVKKYSNSISQIKETQDKLDEILDSNELSEKELTLYENRNAISNFFGDPNAKPEVFFMDLEPGDIILLTTDGIHDNLTTSEINQILSTDKSSKQITKNIITKSQNRSKSNHFRAKRDDMTALVLKVNIYSQQKLKHNL
jgi:PPM family protein phosphatase